jgi:hypothetical protein
MAQHGARLADNGYAVIPIAPGVKKPGRWQTDRWVDYPEWTRHCERPTKGFEIDIWRRWPGCAIGIACGYTIAVDIDVLDAEAAFAIERLARDMLGDTPALRIGKAPKRMLIYRTLKPFGGMKKAPVEILGRGNQFVAYALHPDTGQPYAWPVESLIDIDANSLPVIDEAKARAFLDAADKFVPDALKPRRLVSTPGGGSPTSGDPRGTPEAVAAALAYIPNHELPYDEWMRVGMAIKRAIGEAGRDLWLEWSARAAKDEPEYTAEKWDRHMGRVHSLGAGTIYDIALKYGWVPEPNLILNGAEAEAAAEPHPAAALLAKIAALPQPSAPKPTPAEIMDLDGGLKISVQWMTETAHKPQPFLALGATLAMFGALMGRRYAAYDDLRSNVYIAGIAESGGGKDHARQAIQKLLHAAGLSRYVGGDPASGRALLTAMGRNPSMIFMMDEFGDKLSSLMGKRAPSHLVEIREKLKTLFTSSSSVMVGTEYADQKERPKQDIVQPCACVYATSASGIFWKAIESGSIDDGFFPRFLIFRSDDPIPETNHERARFDPPAELVALVKAMTEGEIDGHKFGNLTAASAAVPTPYAVPFDAEALAALKALDADQRTWALQCAGTQNVAIVNRLSEHVKKLALIRAVARRPSRPVVTGHDIAWARALGEHCIETLIGEADRFMADNETEAKHKKVLEIIRKAGVIGRRELTRRTQFMMSRERDEILRALSDGGCIEIIAIKSGEKGGQPTVRYRFCQDE